MCLWRIISTITWTNERNVRSIQLYLVCFFWQYLVMWYCICILLFWISLWWVKCSSAYSVVLNSILWCHNFSNDSDLTSTSMQLYRMINRELKARFLIKLYYCYHKLTVVPAVTQCVCNITSFKYILYHINVYGK